MRIPMILCLALLLGIPACGSGREYCDSYCYWNSEGYWECSESCYEVPYDPYYKQDFVDAKTGQLLTWEAEHEGAMGVTLCQFMADNPNLMPLD